VFLTPPMGDSFRLRARRAILVGAKAIPKTDRFLGEWYERMLAAYGPDMELTARRAFYGGLDDDARAALARRWRLDYAVLELVQPTERPVVFPGTHFKIVRLR
jgi:hypothetical protein